MTRPAAIPTLAEYLSRHVTDGRAEGYEAFVDFAERTLAMTAVEGALRHEAAMVRWLKVMTVAMVETLNAEDRRGEDYRETLATAARAMGYLTFDLIYAHSDENAPRMPLIKALTAEFREGAKKAADAINPNAAL